MILERVLIYSLSTLCSIYFRMVVHYAILSCGPKPAARCDPMSLLEAPTSWPLSQLRDAPGSGRFRRLRALWAAENHTAVATKLGVLQKDFSAPFTGVFGVDIRQV